MTQQNALLIAHRGLVNGANVEIENHPQQIDSALSKGFDAEVDIWYTIDGGFMLGHDAPTYPVSLQWLRDRADKLWLHAKNLDALHLLDSQFNKFWHESDQHTLTSKGYIWTYPGVKTSASNGIVVMPESANISIKEVTQINCYGICSDYVEEIKESLI